LRLLFPLHWISATNSTSKIPAPVLEAAHLRLDEAVEIRAEAGLIVIEPVRRVELNDLLKGINAGNLHDPVEFGAPRGKEVW
jgi:antitoxin MazE